LSVARLRDQRLAPVQTLALIAGELVAAEIITGHEHPMLTAYRPERFTD